MLVRVEKRDPLPVAITARRSASSGASARSVVSASLV
jgi:hypothetical protein